jgi:hypothetical protein
LHLKGKEEFSTEIQVGLLESSRLSVAFSANKKFSVVCFRDEESFSLSARKTSYHFLERFSPACCGFESAFLLLREKICFEGCWAFGKGIV